VRGAYQQLFGLELEHLAVDGCITKAPAADRSPGRARWIVASRVLKRSTVTDAGGIPLGTVSAAANRRDDGLFGAILDILAGPAPRPGGCPPSP